MDHRAIELAIETLKPQNHITDIESDILKTWEEYSCNPFDRGRAQSRIITNNLKYPDVYASIAAMPKTVTKPFAVVTEEDLKTNLFNQLAFLLLKIK